MTTVWAGRAAHVGRALRTTGSVVVAGVLRGLAIAIPGVLVNWALFVIALHPWAPTPPREIAAGATFGLLLLIVCAAFPLVYFFVGKLHGTRSAVLQVYKAYREEILGVLRHAMLEAWKLEAAERTRALNRILSGRASWNERLVYHLDEIPKPVYPVLKFIARAMGRDVALITILERVDQGVGPGEADAAVIDDVIDSVVSEQLLSPTQTALRVTMALNAVALVVCFVVF